MVNPLRPVGNKHLVGVRVGWQHALKTLGIGGKGAPLGHVLGRAGLPGRGTVLEDAADFDFLPPRVGEEHRAIDHAVDRPRAGAHPRTRRIQGGRGQGLGGRLGAAVDLGRAHANAQQRFDQRRHVGVHVLGGQQHQLGLQVRAGARAQHRGAERVRFGDGYATKPGLDDVFFCLLAGTGPSACSSTERPRAVHNWSNFSSSV